MSLETTISHQDRIADTLHCESSCQSSTPEYVRVKDYCSVLPGQLLRLVSACTGLHVHSICSDLSVPVLAFTCTVLFKSLHTLKIPSHVHLSVLIRDGLMPGGMDRSIRCAPGLLCPTPRYPILLRLVPQCSIVLRPVSLFHMYVLLCVFNECGMYNLRITEGSKQRVP